MTEENIRYSFNVDIKKLEAKKQRLLFDILSNPNSPRLHILLEKVEEELEWHKSHIKKGIGKEPKWY